jgi:hypothetical protein
MPIVPNVVRIEIYLWRAGDLPFDLIQQDAEDGCMSLVQAGMGTKQLQQG